MVHGFPGAVYKSFKTPEEAEAFLKSAPARGEKAHTKGAAQQKATPGAAAQQKSAPAGSGKVKTKGAECTGETEEPAGELRVCGWLFSRRHRRVRLWRF